MTNREPLNKLCEEDPNPPKWPNNGVPFNRWFNKLHTFLSELQYNFSPYRNPKGMKAKYINIRIDTRNGNFVVFCEGNKEGELQAIAPDDLGLNFDPKKDQAIREAIANALKSLD